jgi:hypothetical protein
MVIGPRRPRGLGLGFASTPRAPRGDGIVLWRRA